MEPFEHFCNDCGANRPYIFGGDFAADVLGLYACQKHHAETHERWKRGQGARIVF